MLLSAPDHSRFISLPHFALIEIKGPDSERFLQGQLTCDMRQLTENHWQLGACCTAKGRIIANFAILQHDGCYWLRVAGSVALTLITHLKKYAVFFKTELNISTTKIMGLQAYPVDEHTLAEQASEYQGACDHRGVLEVNNGVISDKPEPICLVWPDGRREYWLSDEQLEEIEQQTTNVDKPVIDAPDSWSQLDILAGLFWIDAQHSDRWIPQQIGWDQVGGVSFSKGCYTGQEIIARLQYLGKSKKVMTRVVAKCETQKLPALINSSTLSDLDDNKIGELLVWSGHYGLAITPYQETHDAKLIGTDNDNQYSVKLIPLVRTEDPQTEEQESAN